MSEEADETPESKEEKRQLAIAREKELADVRAVVSTAEGRRFYWRYMAMAGTFRRSFGIDDATTNFNEGRRSLGNDLFHDVMTAKPEAYLLMQREYASRQNQEKKP